MDRPDPFPLLRCELTAVSRNRMPTQTTKLAARPTQRLGAGAHRDGDAEQKLRDKRNAEIQGIRETVRPIV